jgi:hypothetical protein
MTVWHPHSPGDRWFEEIASEALQCLLHSPDLVPADFRFFGPLNKSFAAGEVNFLHALDVDFFAEGFDALVAHWNRFLSRGSQYVEK